MGKGFRISVLIPYASEGRMLELARRTVRTVWRTFGITMQRLSATDGFPGRFSVKPLRF